MTLSVQEKFTLRSIEQRLKALKYFTGIGPVVPVGVLEKDLAIAMKLVRRLIETTNTDSEFPDKEVKSEPEPECQPTNQNSPQSSSQELPSSAEPSSSLEVQ